MNLKQKLYDLLGQHKGKVQEAQKAVEAGELDRAEALTNEAKSLAGEIEKRSATAALRTARRPRRASASSRRATVRTATRKR